MSLKAFMRENVQEVEPVEVVVSKRFKDESGLPMAWKVGCVSIEDDNILRKECTKTMRKNKKTSAEFDYPTYLIRLAVRCVQFPNLNDTELQNSYDVMCAEDLLSAMLLPGEMNDLNQAVNAVNGFDNSFEDLVDEAKN